ncbi:DUF6992 family protein [Belliella kenyensis]|uniref:DUF6992 family protein n=1 Tax=Belliella kenyensis TaxID=1472724 RepID=A0ABV8EG98_9BACT|nr:hypothetical protein [Belliella kenyensis]MCH7400901.1 hypothetical protein [Belliella kenyensis]MDN3603901.1 hypothetical protein [Belliella kenyensis]
MKIKKINMLHLIVMAFLVLFSCQVIAQNDQPERLREFNVKRIDYNKSGMLILGSWAVGNMMLGGVMANRTSGQTKAFHQMNIYWNTVNLAIAGFGYYSAMKEIPSPDFWETLDAQHGIEKILIVNAALDIAYMAGGFYLNERGLRVGSEQLQGFGKSVILQGAFLMSFDAIKYVFHVSHGKELPEIMQHIGFTPNGLGLVMNF